MLAVIRVFRWYIYRYTCYTRCTVRATRPPPSTAPPLYCFFFFVIVRNRQKREYDLDHKVSGQRGMAKEMRENYNQIKINSLSETYVRSFQQTSSSPPEQKQKQKKRLVLYRSHCEYIGIIHIKMGVHTHGCIKIYLHSKMTQKSMLCNISVEQQIWYFML